MNMYGAYRAHIRSHTLRSLMTIQASCSCN